MDEWSDSFVFTVLATKVAELQNENLFQVIPNPFCKKVKIVFTTKVTEDIQISIVDANGKLIKLLADNKFLRGDQELYWDGADQSGKKVSSGLYFCFIRSETFNKTIKLIFENK